MRLRPLVLDITGAPLIVRDDETKASFTLGEVADPPPIFSGLIVSPPEAPPLIVAPPPVRIIEVQNPTAVSRREHERRAEALRRLKDPDPPPSRIDARDVRFLLDGLVKRHVL